MRLSFLTVGLLTNDGRSRVETDVCLCFQTNPDSFEHGLTPSDFELSLRKGFFDRRTSTGSELFAFLGSGFAQIFGQIVSMD